MALLHYGPDLRIRLDVDATRRVMETIGAHATRGGWVSATDVDGREWSFLVTAGVALWVSEKD